MARTALLLAAQAASSAAIGWPGPARWALPTPVRVAAGALALTGGALAAAGAGQQHGQLTPHVEPPQQAHLVTDGAYALSRHPIYVGLLTAAAGTAVLRRRPEPLVAWAVLATVLHRKAVLEERWLAARFGSDWQDYARRVPRVLGPVPAGLGGRRDGQRRRAT